MQPKRGKQCCSEVNDISMQQQLQIWFDKGKCSGRDEVIFHPEIYGLQKQGEQKPTWSEEDEEHLNSIISDIKTDMGAYPRSQEVIDIYNDDISFLKSLRDRVQPQPKQEWSEEDEYMLKETIQHLEELIRIDKAKHLGCDVQYYQRDIDWLKQRIRG